MFIERPKSISGLRDVVLHNLLMALLYILIGYFGRYYKDLLITNSPIFILSGFAVAMSMVYGLKRTLVGFTIGCFVLVYDRFGVLPVAIGITLSRIIEVIMGTVLLKSFTDETYKFSSPKDILSFVLISVLLAPLISSNVAVVAFYVGNILPENWPEYWGNLFMGRSLGILVLTPILLSLSNKRNEKIFRFEAVALFSVLLMTCHFAFSQGGLKAFLLIPILTWMALRLGFLGIGLATLVVGEIAVWKSLHVHFVFNSESHSADLQVIQLVMYGVAIVGYLLATVVEVHENAQEKELELTIKEDALAILDQSIHKSPIGFALVDKDMKYIRVNEAFAFLNNMEANLHLGRTIQEIAPGFAGKISSSIKDVFNTGKSSMNTPFSSYIPGFPVKFISGLLSFYPVRHPASHEIFAVALSFQDITKLQEIQFLLTENEERLRFAQEAGRIGAFEWDMSTNKIMWTTELENIYELSDGEFGGRYESWLKWVHPQDVEHLMTEMEKVLLDEKELNYEFRIITKSLATRWILARGKMMYDSNGMKKLVGINIDITEQKEAEQKLRLTESNLLHALSVRDEFMAIASHELKTPLTSLKLQNQIFQRGLSRNEPFTQEKIRCFIEKNCVQVDRLTRLVDDMLDISRIRTGKFSIKKEKCELSKLLQDIINRYKEQFEASGSGLPVIEGFEAVYGEWDSLRIDQVFTNIITNAIRYGQGRPITISVQKDAGLVLVTIQDQGLGIPKSDQEKIFHRYERGLLAREISGLGLGLFITKEIVEAHNGRIWVESELHHGSIFYVELPTSEITSIVEENLSEESPTFRLLTETSQVFCPN